MIKIVHIIGALVYGGAERLLLDICRKIDKTQFDISVIVLRQNNDLAKQFEDAGIPVTIFEKKGKLDFGVIERLADYLRLQKPDIVHTHLFAGEFWGFMACHQAKIKNVICTKHGIVKEDFLRDYLIKKATRKMKRVIAISQAVQDYVLLEMKVGVKKISVIYNGIDTDKFYGLSRPILSGETLSLGCVGRLSKEKGQKHLIRACRFLKAPDWKLYLVGDGPMREELEQLSKSLGLEANIVFCGSQADVRPYLDKMDIFVLPSISEGLSLAVLEAASAAKLIIASNVGGLPEIITDKETGLLFTPKNIEQLVSHINWAYEHKEQAQKMALALQQQVMQKFDIDKTIKQYEDLYRNLITK